MFWYCNWNEHFEYCATSCFFWLEQYVHQSRFWLRQTLKFCMPWIQRHTSNYLLRQFWNVLKFDPVVLQLFNLQSICSSVTFEQFGVTSFRIHEIFRSMAFPGGMPGGLEGLLGGLGGGALENIWENPMVTSSLYGKQLFSSQWFMMIDDMFDEIIDDVYISPCQ